MTTLERRLTFEDNRLTLEDPRTINERVRTQVKKILEENPSLREAFPLAEALLGDKLSAAITLRFAGIFNDHFEKLPFRLNSPIETIKPISWEEITITSKSNTPNGQYRFKFKPGINIVHDPENYPLFEALAFSLYSNQRLSRNLVNCTIEGKFRINSRLIDFKRIRGELGGSDKNFLQGYQFGTQMDALTRLAQEANIYQLKDQRRSFGISAFNQAIFCDLSEISQTDFPNIIKWESKQYLFGSQSLRFDLYMLEFLNSLRRMFVSMNDKQLTPEYNDLRTKLSDKRTRFSQYNFQLERLKERFGTYWTKGGEELNSIKLNYEREKAVCVAEIQNVERLNADTEKNQDLEHKALIDFLEDEREKQHRINEIDDKILNLSREIRNKRTQITRLQIENRGAGADYLDRGECPCGHKIPPQEQDQKREQGLCIICGNQPPSEQSNEQVLLELDKLHNECDSCEETQRYWFEQKAQIQSELDFLKGQREGIQKIIMNGPKRPIIEVIEKLHSLEREIFRLKSLQDDLPRKTQLESEIYGKKEEIEEIEKRLSKVTEMQGYIREIEEGMGEIVRNKGDRCANEYEGQRNQVLREIFIRWWKIAHEIRLSNRTRDAIPSNSADLPADFEYPNFIMASNIPPSIGIPSFYLAILLASIEGALSTTNLLVIRGISQNVLLGLKNFLTKLAADHKESLQVIVIPSEEIALTDYPTDIIIRPEPIQPISQQQLELPS